MSMLSSQCDSLKDSANELQNVIDFFAKGHPIYTQCGIVTALHYAINGLRSAADTIKSLSDNLSGMVDCRERARELEKENENLRGKLQALRAHGIEVVDAVAGGVEIYNEKHAELDRLKAENAKLHDLIEALLQCAGEIKRDKGCDACPMWTGDDTDAIHERRWCLLRPTLREVGFEVGEWRVGDDGRLHQVKEVDE